MEQKRLYIIVEGPTEEEFVKKSLLPYFHAKGIYNFVTPIKIKTGKTPHNKKASGGALNFQRLKKEVNRLLKNEKNIIVTSLIDFFRLPSDFPCLDEIKKLKAPADKVKRLEECLSQEIKDNRFIPYIQLHEFEALIFACPQTAILEIAKTLNLKQEKIRTELDKIAKKYPNPEEINEGTNTAPSKRLKKLVPGYNKVVHGNAIIQQSGLDALRQKCPRLAQWLENLENKLAK